MRFWPENRSEELVKRSRELGGLLGGGHLRRRRRAAIGQMGHGEGSWWWDYGGVELAFEGFKLEGVVKRTVAVPYTGLGFFFGFVSLLFFGFLHFWKLWREKRERREKREERCVEFSVSCICLSVVSFLL